jgi:hypothetical protein
LPHPSSPSKVIKVPRLELTESIIPAAIGTGARERRDLLRRAK